MKNNIIKTYKDFINESSKYSTVFNQWFTEKLSSKVEKIIESSNTSVKGFDFIGDDFFPMTEFVIHKENDDKEYVLNIIMNEDGLVIYATFGEANKPAKKISIKYSNDMNVKESYDKVIEQILK